jgi:hypothetical protein
MSLVHAGTIPARRTIFKRHNRWPGVCRRLFVLTIVMIAAV